MKESSIKFFGPYLKKCVSVMFEHLISGPVLDVSGVAVEVSVTGVYLSVY